MNEPDKPLFFDTHCHLDDEAFSDDLQDVVRNAHSNGVREILLIGLNARSSLHSSQIARRYGLRFSAGIHPHEADNFVAGDVEGVRKLAKDPYCAAIGEIGLDFYRKYARRENQMELFRKMLDIACDLQLPVVLHQRAAAGDLLTILDEFALPSGGVFHCFSGHYQFAMEGVKRGMYISFAGNVTYNNSGLVQVAADIPAERLLIETDAPYLPPHPYRGQRNEPAYLSHTAQVIALARDMELNEVASLTRSNGRKLFNWERATADVE